MNTLAGMFNTQAPMSKTQGIGRALAGFGAGVQGRGGEYLSNLQAQDMALDEQRRKAMAQDAMSVYQLLNNNDIEGAINLTNKRISYIQELGGDPSDTIQIRDLLSNPETLDIARQELGLFVQASMENGLLPVPERPEPLPASQIINGQVVTPDGNGYRATPITGFQAEAENARAANLGLSPVWLLDQNDNYVPAQLSSAGGMVPAQVPQGMRAVPPSGQLGFDPNAIAQRGQAQTGVDVAREQAMRPELASTAGAVTGAQQSAEIAAIAPRSEAERAATRAATQGQRIGAIESKEDQVSLLNDLTEQARDLSSGWTTGFIGGAAARIEGTPAYNLARTLDTLQATAGFDTLQEMRDNSPTGGALGQVTERELALLQATWGSLQQAQSKEQFDRALNRFQNQINNSWDRVNRAYERDYGQPYFVGGQQVNPDPAGIL